MERKQYEFYKEMIYYQYPHNRWTTSQLAQLHQFYISHCSELQPLQKATVKHQGQFGADTALSSSAMGSGAADKGLSTEQIVYNKFIDRLCEWMESFQSLYALFRMNFCQYIYLHFESLFNILFVFDHDEVPRVIISNTHQSFRALLERHGVDFSTPMEGDVKVLEKENECKMEEDEVDDEELGWCVVY